MKFTKVSMPEFPVLAWLVEYSAEQSVAVLRHGAMVEIGDDYFVEGVWNGPFAEHGFHATDVFFGSGGRVVGDELVIVPSAATTDYCYYQQGDDGSATVSNSLPLLLAALGDALDPTSKEYLGINNSILRGISTYEPNMPTKRGTINRLVYKNLWLRQGSIRMEDKPTSAPFTCFQDYYNYLVTSYASIASNARDPNRQHVMQIASTQSKGYDSTAINAISVSQGLDAVFSITQSKGHGKFADQDEGFGVDDSGAQIGQVLGFSCTFINRRALGSQPQREHLYYASIHASEDTSMAGVNPHIKPPSMLLTGTLGEITAPWDYYHAHGYRLDHIDSLQRGDHGGHGMGEIRLEVGFIHVPVFYIGARHRKSIMDITALQEMDPWRLNNSYDRPIARRIAEEAGVPRSYFGQQKNAAAMVFTPPLLPIDPTLREEYITYLNTAGVMSRWKWRFLPLVHSLNRVFWFVSPGRHLWLYYLRRAISRLTRHEYHFPTIWHHLDNAYYSFCVNKRADEYRVMLGKATN